MTRDELVAEIARTDPLGVHRLMQMIDEHTLKQYEAGFKSGYLQGRLIELQRDTYDA